MFNNRLETTDYIVLKISKVGGSESSNLNAIDEIVHQICEQFSKGTVEVANHDKVYAFPVSEILD